MHADAWAALGTCVAAGFAGATVVIGGLAAWFARGQVLEARRTRQRVAQPNVVVFADLSPDDWHYLDFVIKNFGETPAYAIKLTLPPLAVVPWDNLLTGEKVTSLYLPDSLVVLAPGQEWRTMWESGIRLQDYETKRKLAKENPQLNLPVEPELQSVFVGRVDYLDADDNPHDNPIYLDTKAFHNVMRVGKE
jgi:hypothetical protein